MNLRNKLVGLGALLPLLASSCSENPIEKRLDLTLWADFNKNDRYDFGEDIGRVGKKPINMSNKRVRILYSGKPNEEVILSLVDSFPHKFASDYIFNSKNGVIRIEDESNFIRELNETLKMPGTYTIIAKPLNQEDFIYRTIDSAYPDDFFEIIEKQKTWFNENQEKK